MKSFTAIALALILVFVASTYDVRVLETAKTDKGTQYHVVRINGLTGDLKACVVSFVDDETPWASCSLTKREPK